MAHLVNSPFQNKALVSGLNCVVANYTLQETASGSTTIAMCGLPAGAQVVDVRVQANHAALNAGANAGAVRVSLNHGTTEAGTLIPTSTLSYAISMARSATDLICGDRLTGSANVVLNIHDCVGTGTASTQFSVIVTYLAELSGD